MVNLINEISKKYELKIEKIVREIKKQKAKIILLQFPDALKPYATLISDEIEKKSGNNVQCLIYMGSCFGACDVPLQVKNLKPKIDMIIQFGHNNFGFKEKIKNS